MAKSILTLIPLGLGAVLLLASCANRPCRELRYPELATQQEAGARPAMQGPSGTTAPAALNTARGEKTVVVYKPDGSLQCQMGQAVKPEEMEKQLSGMTVLSRAKRPDGLMHIQVCGQPTGMINVYEVHASSLLEAERRGFKKFEAR